MATSTPCRETDIAGHLMALAQFPLNRSLNNFRYHGNPILERGASGEWDDGLIRDPMAFYDNDATVDEKFKLYYCGAEADSDGQMQIGLAYGRNLESLTRYPDNPIVTMTEPWENEIAAPDAPELPPLNHTPYVFQIPGSHQYEMLYTGRCCEPDGKHRFSTMRVTSSDGKTWTNKKRVFEKFELGGRVYSPTKPIPIYQAEEDRYYLVFSGSLLDEACAKNEGFVGLATSEDGEGYVFERVIIPQPQAHGIYDPHGLVTMLGWYFLLITHDGDQAFDGYGNEGYPERWMVSRDLRTWYGSLKSIWDTSPDDGPLYSHVTPLLTEAGMGFMVYDYGEPNVFGLVKVPLVGKPYTVVLDKQLLGPQEATTLADSYPVIVLEPGQQLTLTAECAYDRSASSPAAVHVYTSYDGEHWDTEELKGAADQPAFGVMPLTPGQTVRRTRDIPVGALFIKVAVENTDTSCGLRHVKVVAALA